RADAPAQLEAFGVFKTQVELFLQRVRVLVAAYADVAGKQRRSPFHNVDVHHAGAQIQQGHGGIVRRLVVVLVTVLQSKSVNVHNRRRLAGQREHVGVVQNLVFFHSHQQHVHLRASTVRIQDFKIQVHVGDVERNVLRGFRSDAFRQLRFAHGLDLDRLHDDRMPAHGRGYVFGLNAVLAEDFADGAGNAYRVYNHGVHHDVTRQRFHTQVRDHNVALGTLQLNRLDAAGADVQS